MCSQFLALPLRSSSVFSVGEAGLMNEARVSVMRQIVGGVVESETLIRWCAALIILCKIRTFILKSGS